MLGKCAVFICLAVMLAGCRTEPPSTAAPPIPPPTPVAAAPVAEPPPCRGGDTGGPPSFQMRVAGAYINLPFSSCRITVPAGPLTITLLRSNLEEGFPVKVTGAPDGRWENDFYYIDVEVARSETKAVSIDLSAIGRDSITYTLVGAAPAGPLVASAPSRQGPWTDVTGRGLVPADHTWLRINYPLAMPPVSNSIIIPHRYGTADAGLPGVWEGDRTQYVAISDAPPVLYVRAAKDVNGLQMWWPAAGILYRGAPPELQAVTPADGSVRSIYRFASVPGNLAYEKGAVRYLVYELLVERQEPSFRQIDPATGQVSDQIPRPPEPVGSDAPAHVHWPSPDGKLDADLVWDANPLRPADHTQPRSADLIIRDVATGQVVLQSPKWLTSFGAYGCSNAAPGFGWRPDGQVVAALDAPAPDRIALKQITLKGETKTLAEMTAPDAAASVQFEWEVAWSPSGALVTFQSQLIDVGSGRVVAENLARRNFWSPDGRYLLLYQRDHPFTNWGEVALLDVATGVRRPLGHGQGLGWTPDGKALLVRWDVSSRIEPPARGCE